MKLIPLTQGKVTIVDDDVYEWASKFKWYAQKIGRRFYAARSSPMIAGKRTCIFLHRVIMDCPPELEVNHVKGDGLDNRREKLQVCTTLQNLCAYRRKKVGASSKYRGVTWKYKSWQAQIQINGKSHYLGGFSDEKAAALAYDAKARELFGEHAAPNFPA